MSRKPKNHYLAKILGFFFFFFFLRQKIKKNKTKQKNKQTNAKIFKSKKFIKKGRKHSVDIRI